MQVEIKRITKFGYSLDCGIMHGKEKITSGWSMEGSSGGGSSSSGSGSI